MSETTYPVLMVIATSERVPRHFGDNTGAWPVRLVLTSAPKESLRLIAHHQMVHDVEIIAAWELLTSKDHAEIIKAGVEASLWQQGFARVRDGKPAWDCDPYTVELHFNSVAEQEGVRFRIPEPKAKAPRKMGARYR